MNLFINTVHFLLFWNTMSNMESVGKVVYNQFISKLHVKTSSRFLSNQDVQLIGNFFWRLVSEEFKTSAREEFGKNCFWSFCLHLKSCFVSNQLDFLGNLWNYFDSNGRNLFVNLYSNSLENLVADVFWVKIKHNCQIRIKFTKTTTNNNKKPKNLQPRQKTQQIYAKNHKINKSIFLLLAGAKVAGSLTAFCGRRSVGDLPGDLNLVEGPGQQGLQLGQLVAAGQFSRQSAERRHGLSFRKQPFRYILSNMFQI